jgi:hypothetical protein
MERPLTRCLDSLMPLRRACEADLRPVWGFLGITLRRLGRGGLQDTSKT